MPPIQTRRQTKEEYLNIYPGSLREINSKIYDLREIIDSPDYQLRNLEDQIEVHEQMKQLMREKDKPLPPYDNDYNDLDFNIDNISYDEDGTKNDGEYDHKNWHGHDD